jgi:hypothetical protein
MAMTADQALERMERLGRRGLTVSIACGPSLNRFRWSVDVLSPSGDSFEMPFAACTFAHAVVIAEKEAQKRGWVDHQIDGQEGSAT